MTLRHFLLIILVAVIVSVAVVLILNLCGVQGPNAAIAGGVSGGVVAAISGGRLATRAKKNQP